MATPQKITVGRDGSIAPRSDSEPMTIEAASAPEMKKIDTSATTRMLVTVANGNWSSSSGARAFQTLLRNFPQVDGVFTANDQMALAVLHVAHEKGIQVPQDLKVIGFDDLAETPYYSPSLSTIRQDLHELGTMAVKKVIEMVNEPEKSLSTALPNTIILKPQLIVRESTRRS